MRSIMIIGILIVMLIIGMLVVKNMNPDGSSLSESEKMEVMDDAKRISDFAQDKLDAVKQQLEDAQ